MLEDCISSILIWLEILGHLMKVQVDSANLGEVVQVGGKTIYLDKLSSTSFNLSSILAPSFIIIEYKLKLLYILANGKLDFVEHLRIFSPGDAFRH